MPCSKIIPAVTVGMAQQQFQSRASSQVLPINLPVPTYAIEAYQRVCYDYLT